MEIKKDYPELTGKPVITMIGEVVYDGVIQGVNFDIGFSIADKEDPNEYLVCAPGPSAPGHKNTDYHGVSWEDVYECVVTDLLNGVYDGSWKSLPEADRLSGHGAMPNCPWNG